MTDLGIWPTFGRGWARRIASLLEMVDSPVVAPTPEPEPVVPTPPRLVYLDGKILDVEKAT